MVQVHFQCHESIINVNYNLLNDAGLRGALPGIKGNKEHRKDMLGPLKGITKDQNRSYEMKKTCSMGKRGPLGATGGSFYEDCIVHVGLCERCKAVYILVTCLKNYDESGICIIYTLK